MIDILYVSFNRLEMTRESFTALLENTPWGEVRRLYIADDMSTDGAREWLWEQAEQISDHIDVRTSMKRFGGPVAATNWYLDQTWENYLDGEVDRFIKLDNDFVVCPGWLSEILRQATLNAGIDLIGMEPMLGPPVMPPHAKRSLRSARWIGGKGMVRHRAFETCRPTPTGRHGYYGFTEWQSRHGYIEKAWITPDMPCFGLDQLPFEPWVSLTTRYVERKWQRRWPNYDAGFTSYWDWWSPKFLP